MIIYLFWKGFNVLTTVLGSGNYKYKVIENWAQLPDQWSFMDVAGVAVNSKDEVFVFNRGEHPMIIFDIDGNYLRSWGEDLFSRPHGIHIGPDDTLYCTDDGDHTVKKITPEGKLILQIGVSGSSSEFMSNLPFHRCTHTALCPDNNIFVSDGYGNACVHKYSPDGKLIKTFGVSGSGPGQFNLVHNIVADDNGWIYVADRENHRIQVFNTDGKYETQWNNLHRPCGLFMPRGNCPVCIVGELGPGMLVNRKYQNLGPRLSIVDNNGNLITRLGGENGPGHNPGQFLAPHGLSADSYGNIYVGEVSYTNWPYSFGEEPKPKFLKTLQKLERIIN